MLNFWAAAEKLQGRETLRTWFFFYTRIPLKAFVRVDVVNSCIMAPTSPKRRKLDYSSDERVSPDEIPPQSDDESDAQSSSSEVSQEDVPNIQSKQTPSRLKRVQDDNNGALYAGGLYKSSMFKLQVDEMLAEVQPNYEKRAGVIDEALRRLKGLVEGIDGREALSVSCKYIVFNEPPSNTCVDTGGHETTAKIP